MSYYFSAILKNTSYDQAVELATRELQKEGFGVLTKINIRETLKNKIDADFHPYLILGACNPTYAHKALLYEDKVGVFLPCNVVVEQFDNGLVEVSAVDPHAMMASITNPEIESIASEIRQKIIRVIEGVAASEKIYQGNPS